MSQNNCSNCKIRTYSYFDDPSPFELNCSMCGSGFCTSCVMTHWEDTMGRIQGVCKDCFGYAIQYVGIKEITK